LDQTSPVKTRVVNYSFKKGGGKTERKKALEGGRDGEKSGHKTMKKGVLGIQVNGTSRVLARGSRKEWGSR